MLKKVFVSGCYDILHGGHVEFFTQARALGDYLIVSIAGDNALLKHKGRPSSIPVAHKKRLIESLQMVDEVIVSDDTDDALGLNFKREFLQIRPQILAVTEDDRYGVIKQNLCDSIGAEYQVLPKGLAFDPVSTTGIINSIRSPHRVPLRVDFAGGWLDMPCFARPGGCIVNCAIQPMVSLAEWDYHIASGLGSSAAHAILTGRDGVKEELKSGTGWQDPAVIEETGLCVWASGDRPRLLWKQDPDWLAGHMALLHTGIIRKTPELAFRLRDFEQILKAGRMAADATLERDPGARFAGLCEAVRLSYAAQLDEGMTPVPGHGAAAWKYCGGGWGGYAVCFFQTREDRDARCLEIPDMKPVEPFMRFGAG